MLEPNQLTNVSPFEMAVCGSRGYRDMYFYVNGSTAGHSLYNPEVGN